MSISPAGPTLGHTTALNDVDFIIIIVVLYEAHLNSCKWWMCPFHKVSRHYILCNIGEISFVKYRNVSIIQGV